MKSSALKQLARRFSLGKIYLYTITQPIQMVTEYFTKYGGPSERKKMESGRQGMIAAEKNLTTPPVMLESENPLFDICYLTGEHFWYQTAFCFHSLVHHSGMNLRLVLFDDGTLKQEHIDRAQKLFPRTIVYTKEEMDKQIDDLLPREKFPTIRDIRDRQPLLRKVTDLHAGHKGWRLLLDSDMLFFRKPTELMNWISNPTKPVYMVDIKNAYGFSHESRYALVQKKIHDRINIGIFGMKSETIDFEKLEYWLKTLLSEVHLPYNVTQGVVSMLLAGEDCLAVDEKEYIVLPEGKEAFNPTATLHHYVTDSKVAYFQAGWQHYLSHLND